METWVIENLLIALPWAMLTLSYFPTGGMTGTVVLCNAAWAGAAAYSVSILASRGASLWLSVIAAVILANLLAFLTWLLASRSRGLTQTMSSVAMSIAIVALISGLDHLTGGERGLLAPACFSEMGRFSLLLVLLTLGSASCISVPILLSSTFGKCLLSTRKMEPLMELAGHSASLLKLAAFLLSSTIAGVAGVLIAVGRPSLSPQLFGVDTSISLLAVFVLSGGLSHPTSPLRIFSTQLVLSLLIQLLQMWSWMPPSLIIAAYYLLLAIALLTSFIRKSRRDC